VSPHIPKLSHHSHVQSHPAIWKNNVCDSHTLCAAATAMHVAGLGPRAADRQRPGLGHDVVHHTTWRVIRAGGSLPEGRGLYVEAARARAL
jgi:hypothetical protein